MKAPKQYEVVVSFRGKDVSQVVTARSRSAARFDIYLDWSDACEISFRDFLRHVLSVRRTARRTPYDYIREHYGVAVEVGQPVTVNGERGIVGEPGTSRASMVTVFLDGVRHGLPVHPGEIQS